MGEEPCFSRPLPWTKPWFMSKSSTTYQPHHHLLGCPSPLDPKHAHGSQGGARLCSSEQQTWVSDTPPSSSSMRCCLLWSPTTTAFVSHWASVKYAVAPLQNLLPTRVGHSEQPFTVSQGRSLPVLALWSVQCCSPHYMLAVCINGVHGLKYPYVL